MNTNKPFGRHSGEGRNPVKTNTREAAKIMLQSRFRGEYFLNWIPAFAGMTRFCANEQYGFKQMMVIAQPVLSEVEGLNPSYGRQMRALP